MKKMIVSIQCILLAGISSIASAESSVKKKMREIDGERYEVLDGVRVGEEIVTQGVFFLKSALIKDSGEGG